MISRREIVMSAIGIAQDRRDQQSEHGSNPDRDNEIGAIAQLTHERAAQERAQLSPFIVPTHWLALFPRWSGRQSGRRFFPERNVFDVLDEAKRFVLVPPKFRRVTARCDQLTAIILFVNNVAA